MNPQAPVLRGVVKFHKQDLSIRPIVNNVSSPCHKLAKFLNFLLSEHLSESITYTVKNSLHLVSCLRDLVLPNAFRLISFDIANMYSSIPVPDCLETVELGLSSIALDSSFVAQIMSLLRFLLSNNYFRFEESFYSQPMGLAMGSPLSPILADLFMDRLEKEKIISDENPFLHNIITWHRYVDDVICLWSGDDITLMGFLDYLNSCNDNIQFSIECEKENTLNFLDLSISHEGATLTFDVFRKAVYASSMIHSSSRHHIAQKCSGFYAMLYRLNKLPLSIYNYRKELNTICVIAQRNGYSDRDIFGWNRRVRSRVNLERSTSLSPIVEKKLWRSIPYMGQISVRIGSALIKSGFGVAYKSGYNLSKILNPRTPPSFDAILSKSGVYKLTCPCCGSTYIGQTGRSFSTRFGEHISDGRKLTLHPMSNFSRHLATSGHEFTVSEKTVEILRFCQKSVEMSLWEKLYISVELGMDNSACVNEDIFSVGPIMRALLNPQVIANSDAS